MEIAAAIGLGFTAVGMIGAVSLYVIRTELRGDVTRLDGRINGHELECTQRRKSDDERHTALTNKLDHMDDKLDRLIEARP